MASWPSASFLPPPIINPSAGNTSDDIWYISPDSGIAPRFQNWSLSVQRQLPWRLVAEVAYIGNRGTRQSANHFPLNNLDPKYYALGTLLEARIDAPAVVAAGYRSPYPNFIADWGSTATLARALRPYPHINGPINNEYNPVGSSWYDRCRSNSTGVSATFFSNNLHLVEVSDQRFGSQDERRLEPATQDRQTFDPDVWTGEKLQ